METRSVYFLRSEVFGDVEGMQNTYILLELTEECPESKPSCEFGCKQGRIRQAGAPDRPKNGLNYMGFIMRTVAIFKRR